MLSSSAVGRISFGGNEAKAISARKAVPPAWPTAAYSRDTTPNSSANMLSRYRPSVPPTRLWRRVGKSANASRAFAGGDSRARKTQNVRLAYSSIFARSCRLERVADLPDGQISNLAVQPSSEKYFA